MYAKIEKIVDYSFERDEKSNVLAIHPTKPLIAYLINIQRTQKISKAWSSANDPAQSPSSSSINGQQNQSSNTDKTKTVSIRIIDYGTRQRCLAKGVYHARPADCVFTINSLLCSQADVIKLAVVDRLANVYLYDLAYFINDLVATRIAVIRGPAQEVSPYESIILVWCPFVPCEDFDDGDGGLRLALATNSKIEIFAIDRLQGKTGELQRNDVKGACKCIHDAHNTNIVTLSVSPDCSTISAAAKDNRVTFFSSDIDDTHQRCLHSWEASVTDRSSISKLFFLDDYPKLLEDSTMKFWGAAFIGTRSGQMLLVDLRTWSVYQKTNIASDSAGNKNFDYRIDLSSRSIIAMNGNECFLVQIEHDHRKSSSSSSSSFGANNSQQNPMSLLDTTGNTTNDMMNGDIFTYLFKSASTPGSNQKLATSRQQAPASTTNNSNEITIELPRIIRTTKLDVHGPIYSFVIKQNSDDELELFTISAFSLERYIINLAAINRDALEAQRPATPPAAAIAATIAASTPAAAAIPIPATTTTTNVNTSVSNNSLLVPKNVVVATAGAAPTPNLDVGQMDKMVEVLFTKLNTAFSQGLDEFLSDVKCEVNDLKLKLNGLCRDVRKLQQQLQETCQK